MLKQQTKTAKDEELSLVSFHKYCKNKSKEHPSFKESSKKDGNLAIVYAVGPIESGKSTNTNIGSETVAKAIRS